MPRVSIITPTYNHAGYIGEAIDSVLAQTFADWEMLVVDDGSTDGTGDVVERYDDPRIRLFRKPNGGIMRLAEGYNLAVAEARGDLLAILEGDDRWPPDKLALQVPEFDDPDVVLVSGYALVVDDEGTELGRTPGAPMPNGAQTNQPVGAATRAMLNPRTLNFTFPVATMMRKSAIERIGGFRQPADLPLVDYPTALALSVEGEFRFVPEPCGYWRRHPASTTTSRFPDILEGCYREGMRLAQAEGMRIRLGGEELDGIERTWEEYQAYRCNVLGLILSQNGRPADAVRAFKIGDRFRRSNRTRLIARFGSAAAALRLPVSWVFRLAHPRTIRHSWRNAELIGDDPIVRLSDVDRPWPVHRHGAS